VALTRQAPAAVSVGTYWPWEPTVMLQSALCRRVGGARRPQREERGGDTLWRPPAYSLLVNVVSARFAVEKLKMDSFGTVN